MPEIITPIKIQQIAKRGMERLVRYRAARAMFIKEYVGQYYRSEKGVTGNEPLNLLFHAVKSLVSAIVMKNPKNEVSTPISSQRFYGELLGMAIDSVQQKMKINKVLRGWLVDAFFAIGIIKTGLADDGMVYDYDNNKIKRGSIYCDLVDLDNFVIDPACTDFDKALFMGDVIRVSRQILLDTDGYNHDLVAQLPRSNRNKNKEIQFQSKRKDGEVELENAQDCVDVLDLWVPKAEARILIPDPRQKMFSEYIGISDYYGPDTGPYTFLSLTPPVPNNPLPIAAVSNWYDMHVMFNKMMVKVMTQADRQKDVAFYAPANVDEALDVQEAKDGDYIPSAEPKSVNVVSFGGQNRNNEVMLSHLQTWFNYISSNPDQISGNTAMGTRASGESATKSSIIQSNSSIGVEDIRGLVYDAASEISKNVAWFLHTDPFINLPLSKRAEGGKTVDIRLTPEQRSGDFLNFIFRITARSMTKLDPAMKVKRIMDFAASVVPSLMNSALLALQMGVQFNPVRALTDLAKEMDITNDVQDWFVDPEFEQKMQLIQKMGPQNPGKGSQVTPAAMAQNGAIPSNRTAPSQRKESNQDAQMGANESQSMNKGTY